MHILAGPETEGRTVKSQCCHQSNTQGSFSNGAAFPTLHTPPSWLWVPCRFLGFLIGVKRVPAPRAVA